MINVFQPSLGEEELSAVREVFESCWTIVQDSQIPTASWKKNSPST